MTSKNLEEAKQECLSDLSCNKFYEVCGYGRFRKCNDTAYEELSECGLASVSSTLYKTGNVILTFLRNIITYIVSNFSFVYIHYAFLMNLF